VGLLVGLPLCKSAACALVKYRHPTCNKLYASTGTVPTEIGKLQQLEWIELLFNQLSGSLPTEIGQLTRTNMLSAASNTLDGALPTELGLLSSLFLLSLAGNRLTGPLPSELGLLTNLTVTLNLNKNQFSGTIPTELGLLSKLEVMTIYETPISGKIPSEFGLLVSLQQLTLWNNSLSGSIPKELSALQPSLYAMGLEGNPLLSGIIPDGLCDIDGACVTTALQFCAEQSVGLSFDCSMLLCGCNCSCIDGRSM
jgi:hypothetical protein